MLLDGHDPAPFALRRKRLAEALAGQTALFPSGKSRARNYAANVYPFRAVSHFLYLVGLPLREAMLLCDGNTWTLYLPKPGPDDALWHGSLPSFADIAAAAGCPVQPLDDLPAVVRGHPVATLPAPDFETCADQGHVLGREIRPGRFSLIDSVLADAVIAQRLVHDDAAQAEMRAAADATAAAHRAGMRATRPGLKEAAVRAAMEAEITLRGLPVAYGSIVTVHGEVLHNDVHHHEMKAGDMLLADVGAESAGGFAGDVTRTWPVSGRYSPTQRDLYDVVLRAQKATIAAVKPGARYRDLHLLAAREIAAGLVALGILRGEPAELVADGVSALLFPHGVGHLLGLDVHDMEDLGDRAGYASGRSRSNQFGLSFLRLDRDLVPGMGVTIEPGIYLVPAILESPELRKVAGDRLDRQRLAAFADVRGIRIEDDVLVTATGAEVLTAAIPKERDAVEAVVRG